MTVNKKKRLKHAEYNGVVVQMLTGMFKILRWDRDGFYNKLLAILSKHIFARFFPIGRKEEHCSHSLPLLILKPIKSICDTLFGGV